MTAACLLLQLDVQIVCTDYFEAVGLMCAGIVVHEQRGTQSTPHWCAQGVVMYATLSNAPAHPCTTL
jgi:hypothetical protein